MIGQVFGWLTVETLAAMWGGKESSWWCRCTCGELRRYSTSQLLRGGGGGATSCGCRKKQSQMSTERGSIRFLRMMERFETKFIHGTEAECWEWQASFGPGDYGQFGAIPGWSRKSHRLSYEIYIGDIPEGLNVCHTCDNTKCVNPSHLFIGTQADNLADMDAKGRRVCPEQDGENNGNAKLTENKVRQIRKMFATGKYSKSGLSRIFGVKWTAIYDVINRKRWTNVD